MSGFINQQQLTRVESLDQLLYPYIFKLLHDSQSHVQALILSHNFKTSPLCPHNIKNQTCNFFVNMQVCKKENLKGVIFPHPPQSSQLFSHSAQSKSRSEREQWEKTAESENVSHCGGPVADHWWLMAVFPPSVRLMVHPHPLEKRHS